MSARHIIENTSPGYTSSLPNLSTADGTFKEVQTAVCQPAMRSVALRGHRIDISPRHQSTNMNCNLRNLVLQTELFRCTTKLWLIAWRTSKRLPQQSGQLDGETEHTAVHS